MFSVSDKVRLKDNGQNMVVIGFASGMVECCWYDGYGIKHEAFREEELSLSTPEPFRKCNPHKA